MLGTKLLREDEYQKWDIMYQKAASSISDDRDDLINECAELIEKDLQLVGITAIEDKLQVLNLEIYIILLSCYLLCE